MAEVEHHVQVLEKQYSGVSQIEQSVSGHSESVELSSNNNQSEEEKLASAEGGNAAPVLLRGISAEEDIPESRTECDEELSLPSVKSLMSKFNMENDTSIRRVSDCSSSSS